MKQLKHLKFTFLGTNLVLATQSKDGFTIDPKAIDKFNKLAELAEKQGKASLDRPAGLVEPELLEEYLQKQKEQEEEHKEKEKDTGEREEEKEDNKIKDDLDEEKENEDKDNEKTDENQLTRDSSWIEIRKDREVNEMQTFMGLIKQNFSEIGDIQRTFIAPNKKDGNSYKLVVQDKNGKYKEVPLEQTEGRNPDHEQVTTIQNDGTKAEKKMPIQILKINRNTMIMIFNGTRTNTQVAAGTINSKDDYTGATISTSDAQNNLKDPDEDVKKQISGTTANFADGGDREKAYAVMISFERQGVPDEINPAKDQEGIEAKEIESVVAVVKNLEEGLKEKFYNKGINMSNEGIKQVADSMIEGKQFPDAMLEGMRVEEGAGRIPPDSAEKRADDACEALEKGDEMENGDKSQKELGDRLPK